MATKTVTVQKPKNGDVFVLVFAEEKNGWIKFPKSKDVISTVTKMSSLVPANNISFVDFGGVAEHFLGGRGDDPYKDDPPKIDRKFSHVFVYSYMPPKRFLADCEDVVNGKMTTVVRKAGFYGLIVTTEKHGLLGKASILYNLINHSGKTFTNVSYFEDTAEILDELFCAETTGNTKNESTQVNKYWVLPDEEEFRKNPPKAATTLSSSEFTQLMLE